MNEVNVTQDVWAAVFNFLLMNKATKSREYCIGVVCNFTFEKQETQFLTY